MNIQIILCIIVFGLTKAMIHDNIIIDYFIDYI